MKLIQEEKILLLTVLGSQNHPLPTSKSIIFSMLLTLSLESLIDSLKRGVSIICAKNRILFTYIRLRLPRN